MELVSTIPGVHYDELIGGTAVSVLNANVTLTGVVKDAVVPRGTLLTLAAGVAGIVKPAQTEPTAVAAGVAAAILAENVIGDGETDGMVVTVYVRGLFNREKLIAQTGDTVDAHEDELRDVGIYLTSIKG